MRFKKSKLLSIFLNIILFRNYICMVTPQNYMEGTVSQILYVGLSFCCMPEIGEKLYFFKESFSNSHKKKNSVFVVCQKSGKNCIFLKNPFLIHIKKRTKS